MTMLEDLEREAVTLIPGRRDAVAILMGYLKDLGATKQLQSYFLTTDFASGSADALMDVGAVIGSAVHLFTLGKDGQIEGYSVTINELGPMNVKTDKAGVTVSFGPAIGNGWTLRGEGQGASRLLSFISTLSERRD